MVNASSVQGSSSIIVSWREVPCQKRNGEIVGYVVEYKTSATRQRRQTKEMIVMVELEQDNNLVHVSGTFQQ